MSLFPAYAKQANDVQDETQEPWLENSSFRVDPIPSTSEVTTGTVDLTSPEIPKKRPKKKHKRNKKEKKDEEIVLEQPKPQTGSFVIDVKGYRELLMVNTISRPAAPRYQVTFHLSPSHRHHKDKFKRYHRFMLEKKVSKNDEGTEVVITKQNIDKLGVSERNDGSTVFKEEEELSKKTSYFNARLATTPEDIKLWIEYVNFQDIIHQFEKTHRKGSIAKAQRVLAEKKLAIIDKALSFNPDCELLHRERLRVAQNALPADELQKYLEVLVDKEKSNIILWQGYIETTQCSMSHCNTASVMELYVNCLKTLHQLRRSSSLEKHQLEESILKMLYQCGIFLKQAGLFEQLWTLLHMYLELNLSPSDRTTFNISSNFEEKQLVELEEVIFTSQLPLHELWLRVEKLREACHWLPVEANECEDPQRIVFAEDVAELIHPITLPENMFRLVATIFSLLKIPLLPCRHTTLKVLGLDYVPWSLDSIEPLLATYFPLYPVDVLEKTFLKDMVMLSVGPQYLKTFPGKEEYLEFIIKVMYCCASCLTGDDKIAIVMWLFRFKRLIIILDKLNFLKLDEKFKKSMKKRIKDFLKHPDNRSNEMYYLEYALIEHELGNIESCLNIINTALTMNSSKDFAIVDWDVPQTYRCNLYKNLVHLSLMDAAKTDDHTLQYLCELVFHQKVEDITPEIIKEAEIKFNHVTVNIMQADLKTLHAVHHFHPDFFTDWVTCHAWFIYLTKGAKDCNIFLQGITESLEVKNVNHCWRKEVIYELHTAILFRQYMDKPAGGMCKILDKVLHKALEKYTNNLFLLSVLAKEQSMTYAMGPRWWRVQKLLLRSERAYTSVFVVVIVNQQMAYFNSTAVDTITGKECQMGDSLKNRVLSLYKRLTSEESPAKKCGLIWRLYLQFLYIYSSPQACRNAYYAAVEECPWLKALYIDAAIYIPAELGQIQDLIIEKQLRLHVTPEELDALRS